MLKLNTKIWLIHVITLFFYYTCWFFYEVSYLLWINDASDDDEGGINDFKLRTLAACELCYNISSVFLGLLLFRTMEKMTCEV